MSVPRLYGQQCRGLITLRSITAGQKFSCTTLSLQRQRLQSSFSDTRHPTLNHVSKQQGKIDEAGSRRRSDLPPHSLLPTPMLLRSLLVSTISSSPFLLRSALKFLTLLTKKPNLLLDVNKNWLLYMLLKKTFYEHFCAGENLREVTSTIRNIKTIGFSGVILTYAREIVVDERTKQERGLGAQAAQEGATSLGEKEKHADIMAWRSGVLETLEMLDAGDFLALKFTGAGETVTQSLRSNESLPTLMQEALAKICSLAEQRNVRILVDAEQQSVQPAIDAIALDLMSKYNRTEGKAIVYNTYQMYLKASTANLDSHMQKAAQNGYTLGVKVVRGAYMNSEPRHLIHDTKSDTDNAYDKSLEAMMQRRYIEQGKNTSSPGSSEHPKVPSINVFVASHNKASSLSAVKWYRERLSQNLPTVDRVEFGQLLGMADEVSCGLLQMNNVATVTTAEAGDSSSQQQKIPEDLKVYKCLSWGSLDDCLSYLLRRAVENKDAVSRTKSEAIATRKEILRRIAVFFRIA